MTLILDPTVKALLAQHDDVFATLAAYPGEVYSEDRGRVTKRIDIAGRVYFLKYHSGVGWGEIFKNLARGCRPVLTARDEYLAIKTLEKINLATMTIAGFGKRGCNPARLHSFLLTEALQHTESLDNLFKSWLTTPPPLAFKHALINKLGNILKQFHAQGLNHRDCYLCHFRLQLTDDERYPSLDQLTLYIMDLHRCQQRRQVPWRWLVKDLGSLYFSALHIGLTQRDFYRFIKAYTGLELRAALQQHTTLWQAVQHRCQQLVAKHS